MLLADTKSRLGSVESVFVGGHQAESESFSGSCFHDFLAEVNLLLPSTFEQKASSRPGWTWRSAQDMLHRVDYAGLQVEWAGATLVAQVLESVDLGAGT